MAVERRKPKEGGAAGVVFAEQPREASGVENREMGRGTDPSAA